MPYSSPRDDEQHTTSNEAFEPYGGDWGFLLHDLCRNFVRSYPRAELHLIQQDGDRTIARHYRRSPATAPAAAPDGQPPVHVCCRQQALNDADWLDEALLPDAVTLDSNIYQSLLTSRATCATQERATLRINCPAPARLLLVILGEHSLEYLGLNEAILNQFRTALNAHFDGEQVVLSLVKTLIKPLRLPYSLLSLDRKFVYANSLYQAQFGYPLFELLGNSTKKFRSGRHSRHFYMDMWAQVRKHGIWTGKVWHRTSAGSLVYCAQILIALRDTHNQISHYCCIYQTANTPLTSQQITDTSQDPLTGLLNQEHFLASLKIKLDSIKFRSQQFALILINIDNFAEVNENFGHSTGDKLLAEISKRLVTCAGKGDLLARIYGDEFALVTQLDEYQSNPERLATTIKERMQVAFEGRRNNVYISASLGIAIAPQDGNSPQSLIHHANQALKKCKQSSRTGHVFYQPHMQRESLKKNRLKSQLHKAIASKLLQPYFQGIVSSEDGRIQKAEVLARWRDDAGHFISPADFIPIAQEFGLIDAIGTTIMDQALACIRRWNDQGLTLPMFSFNKSTPEFAIPRAADHWLDQIARHGVAPSQVVIEITEDVLMSDANALTQSLVQLRRAGVKIAIDDFGTGYSSFSYLINNPVDMLKIDRIFIHSLEQPTSLILIKSILQLAHDLGIEVVAEGIETEPQLRHLQHLGCRFIQGYFFHRPVDGDAFEALLRKQQAPH